VSCDCHALNVLNAYVSMISQCDVRPATVNEFVHEGRAIGELHKNSFASLKMCVERHGDFVS
jgi:hypothetical protein